MKKIAIITGGGDCGGLNAVIRGAALAALQHNARCYVIPNGYAGLFNLSKVTRLTNLDARRLDAVDATLAGSEAGHSRVNLKKFSDEVLLDIKANLERLGIDGLVISGGDDTAEVMVKLQAIGIKCVHAPKTMDLDLQTYSVGGDSTIGRIANFARDLRTTARTHNRIFAVEVFGRYAGHTAFRGGIAAQADAILIPEIHVDFDYLAQHMVERYFDRIAHSDVRAGTYLIVVAEGLKDEHGRTFEEVNEVEEAWGRGRLGGAAHYVERELTARIQPGTALGDHVRQRMQAYGLFVPGQLEAPEIRHLVTGHLVRCGQSSAYDVNFGLEVGAAATWLLLQGQTGLTVAGVHGKTIRVLPTVVAREQRLVDLDQVAFHEQLGVCFGRRPVKVQPVVERLAASPERYL